MPKPEKTTRQKLNTVVNDEVGRLNPPSLSNAVWLNDCYQDYVKGYGGIKQSYPTFQEYVTAKLKEAK